ncbi:Uncharacterized protein TCM_006815 [Theobroma cacao]|uniref:Uncharacterized protein n=1 Tax=Theobroma cacao TaxID=3641 RepID=A0A061DZS4_THECC|nr:Uncharacterized protein TCM_006815 [Theobroma cacao]
MGLPISLPVVVKDVRLLPLGPAGRTPCSRPQLEPTHVSVMTGSYVLGSRFSTAPVRLPFSSPVVLNDYREF